jgi:hypothetical protein
MKERRGKGVLKLRVTSGTSKLPYKQEPQFTNKKLLLQYIVILFFPDELCNVYQLEPG